LGAADPGIARDRDGVANSRAFRRDRSGRGVCLIDRVVTRSEPERGGAEDEQQIEAAVLGIKGYLFEHPNASDTLQGVCDWWLMAHHGTLRAGTVQIALDRLVARRILEARPIPGGVVYGRVRHRDE